MVETMKNEGFTALIHTAAASNLGQMLQKICLNDGVVSEYCASPSKLNCYAALAPVMYVTLLQTSPQQ